MHMTVSPYHRLDELRREERYAHHQVADTVALWLYGRSSDDLPASVRTRVEGAALRALRAPQGAWMAVALQRAHVALDEAMAQEMGPVYRMQAPAARQAQARIAVQIVVAAFIGTLELSNPFDGAGDALKVYDAADAAQREVR